MNKSASFFQNIVIQILKDHSWEYEDLHLWYKTQFFLLFYITPLHL